jgi:predicted DNA-binding protein with PD1-like motif
LRLVTVERDQEVLETLSAAVADLGIRDGSVSLIGAVQECTVSVMHKDDALSDRLRTYDQPFELTGTGEVVDGRVHVHVVLAGEDVTAAGHLHRAVVRDFFVRAYITSLD